VRHKDVWICRRIDIANHWRVKHPFAAAGGEAGGA
jgi:hypothetical protein